MPRFIKAHDYIIGAIHPAEAQVCANWVLLRRETRLATLFILKYYSALRAPLLESEATLCGRFSLAENRNFGSWHA